MMRMSDSKQAAFAFIPGKNWKLSLAELVSYLEARDHRFKITDLSKPFFAVTSEKPLEPSIVMNLGGMIKAGRVLSYIPLETVEDAFFRGKRESLKEIEEIFSADCRISEIFNTSSKKCVYGVSLYFENLRYLRCSKAMQRFWGGYLKNELKALGVKARFMGFPRNRRLPQLTHVEVLKKRLIEESAEILFCIGRKRALVANTIAVHDPFEFQKRDVERPVQRSIFSIPPRLARIMVNLSSCLPGKALLDPFCGVGTVLQEAMLIKAQVIGMDINPWCVKASDTNLDWLKRNYRLCEGKGRIMQGDSRRLGDKVGESTVDCIVTEPDLGPPLRHFPTAQHARKLAARLAPLYYDFLEGAYRVLKEGGRAVFVTPYIRTRKGEHVSLDIEGKASALGFNLVHVFRKELFADDAFAADELTKASSFVDMMERHKIGREIHVFEK